MVYPAKVPSRNATPTDMAEYVNQLGSGSCQRAHIAIATLSNQHNPTSAMQHFTNKGLVYISPPIDVMAQQNTNTPTGTMAFKNTGTMFIRMRWPGLKTPRDR
mmetsp:Transcript_70452/g.139789  ORF Transcript_70452/g.139789 Transcript_70452/m.139789 type:complete len:103 (-) Transcript_70452:134-442(-)